jgi:O-antigen/teichoic acid export membrane protein
MISWKSQISKNALWGIARVLILLPLGFFIPPYIIKNIGMDQFGIWALVGAFTSYLGVVDMGLGYSLTVFVAKNREKNGDLSANDFIGTSITVYTLLGLFLLFLIWIFRNKIAHTFFNVSAGQQAMVAPLLMITCSIFVFNLIFSAFNSVVNGCQRMDLTNKISILFGLLNAVTVIMALKYGFGLLGLVIATSIASIISAGLSIYLAHRVYPKLNIGFGNFKVAAFKNMFALGFYIQSAIIAGLIMNQTNKAIMGYFLPIAAVGLFELASRVSDSLRQVPLAILAPIMSAAPELHSQGDSKGIEKMYGRSMKYLNALCLPMYVFLFIFAQKFVTVWVGPDHNQVALALRYLLVANYGNVLTGGQYYILNGIGKAHYGLHTALIAIPISLAGGIVFTKHWGFEGMLVAITAAYLIPVFYYMWIFYRETKFNFTSTFIDSIKWPLIYSVVLALGTIHIYSMFVDVMKLYHILMAGTLFLILYCIFIWFTKGVVDAQGKEELLQKIKKIF